MKTGKERDEKEVLDRQQHADIVAQKNLEENLQQLQNRERELDSQQEQMRTRLKRISDTSAKHKAELEDLKNQLRAMQEKHRTDRYAACWFIFFTDAFAKVRVLACLGPGRCIFFAICSCVFCSLDVFLLTFLCFRLLNYSFSLVGF